MHASFLRKHLGRGIQAWPAAIALDWEWGADIISAMLKGRDIPTRRATLGSSARRRSVRDGLALALVLLAASAGFADPGHDHQASAGVDDHHCAICYVKHTSILPASVVDAEPTPTPVGEARGDEPAVIGSIAPRLSPPLRGPPVC